MKSTFDSKHPQTANHSKATFFVLIQTFATALFLVALVSPSQAAITWDGEIDPSNPTTWTTGTMGYIGISSMGTISVGDASELLSKDGYLGYNSGSNGTAKVTGNGSKWTHFQDFYVGNSGTGILNIEAGGMVSDKHCFLGNNAGSSGTATVTGNNSTWTNTTLGVGEKGTGLLNIKDGGLVSCSTACDIASYSGSAGTVTVTGAGSKLNLSGNYPAGSVAVGMHGTGILNIKAGGLVNATISNIGIYSGSSGTVTVTGADSKWINSSDLIIGKAGSGTLNIEAGGQVSNLRGTLGNDSDSSGTVTVTGENSKWNCTGDLRIGNYGNYGDFGRYGSGSLTVKDGGTVVVGKSIYATSTLFGNGTISANGGVVDANLVFDAAHGSQGTSNFDSGGTLTITPSANNPLGVGYLGNGTLRITEGVTVSSFLNYLGYHYGSSGTATVTGAGSKWTAGDHQIYVGYSGNGTLNIGSGIASEGMVHAKEIKLSENVAATATCNLNGGTLQTSSITIGSGTASFIWNDGTIRNFDASTGLAISNKNNLILRLAATGTHVFNIDAGRAGAISAILSDATSGGTLSKQGDGLLALGAANTYSGATTIEGGQLKLTSGGNIAFSSEIINRAGFVIDGGNHTVKKITGSGTTQVLTGSLTAASIVQDTLTIGGTTNAVPEPSSLILLTLSALAILAWRRKSRVGQA